MLQDAVPLVSVIMVAYKPDPTYLSQALASVLAQTWQDFELIIVEDPSSQPAAATVSRWRDARLRHVCNPSRTSFIEQRQRSLAEARADLVAVIDADDCWEPVKLEKQLAFLQSQPDVDVIGTQISVIDGDGRPCGKRLFPCTHDAIVDALRRYNPISHPSVLFKRRRVLGAGGYVFPGPCHDYELWCRTARHGLRFANIPEALVRYRIHPDQIKASKTRESLVRTLAIKEQYWRDQWTLRDRMRICLEKGLLFLPSRVIFELGKLAYYYDPHCFLNLNPLRRTRAFGRPNVKSAR
jgi:glycosyltransferase involved in cell wall biosynthesis